MCPSGIATSRPARELLAKWSQLGCPTQTRWPWSKQEMTEAVEHRPHKLALSQDVLQHFAKEAAEKVAVGQATTVDWDSIKDKPPTQLKISLVAAIPHKSRGLRLILDLSFKLRLSNGGILPLVNDTTIKMAPKGVLNQLRHSLSCINHAFAEVEDKEDVKYSWQSGMLRMDSGGCAVRMANNGISLMSSHIQRATPSDLWCQLPFRWDGMSPHRISAWRPKRPETLQRCTLTHWWDPYPLIKSLITLAGMQRQANFPKLLTRQPCYDMGWRYTWMIL
jgi:hypothetical protein